MGSSLPWTIKSLHSFITRLSPVRQVANSKIMERLTKFLYKEDDPPLKFFEGFLNLAVKTRSIPFRLITVNSGEGENTTQRFETFRGKWDILIWRFIFAWTFLYSLFIGIDLLLYYPTYLKEKRILELLLAMVWVLSFFVICSSHFHFTFRLREIVLTLNNVLGLDQHINVTDSSVRFQSVWRKVDILAGVLRMDAVAGITFYGFLFWLFPTHRRYIFAFLPLNWQTDWLRSAMAISEALFIAFQWTGFVTSCIFNVLYIDTCKTALELVKGAEPTKVIRMFRILRVLGKIHYTGFGTLGLPVFKLAICLTSLCSVAAAIKLAHEIDPVVIGILYVISGSTTGFLLVILPLAGSIHQTSTECVLGLKKSYGHRKDKEFKAQIRTCQPIGIHIGTIYIIERGTVLTFLGIMLGNLTNVLVTLKEY